MKQKQNMEWDSEEQVKTTMKYLNLIKSIKINGNGIAFKVPLTI